MAAPNWTIIHKEHDGTTITTFAQQNLSFTLNKGEVGPHQVNYEASRSQSSVGPTFVGPYRTDFELWRDGMSEPLIAGMHTPFGISSNQESVQISGKSYLHYLERRQWDFDDSDPNAFRLGLGLSSAPLDIPPTGYAYHQQGTELGLIIKDLLDMVLMDANSLDFTYSIPATGHNVDLFQIEILDTEYMYSKIQTLSQEDPGEFDFWMDSAKVFRMIMGRQYDPETVDELTAEHVFDSTVLESGFHEVDFGNLGPLYTWLVGRGQGGSYTLANVREYLAGSATFRRLDGSVDFGNVPGSTRVSRLTRKKLLFGLNPVHEISLTVVTDKVTDFWDRMKPGIAIWLKADLEGWNIDSAQEIVSIDCAPDLNGNELATLKLNQIYPASGITI